MNVLIDGTGLLYTVLYKKALIIFIRHKIIYS